MLSTRSARTTTKDTNAAIGELVKSLKGSDGAPKFVMVFAAVAHPLAEVLAGVGSAFPDALVAGCSSCGEFTDASDGDESLSALAFFGDLQVQGAFSNKLGEGVAACVAQAADALGQGSDADYPYSVGLLLFDALAGSGEQITLHSACSLGVGVPLAGGAAADDWKMAATRVGLGNQVGSDALVLVRLRSKAPIGIGVAHGHVPVSEPMEVTNAEGSLVLELDGKPAWQAWRDAAEPAWSKNGFNPEDLAAQELLSQFFMIYQGGLDTGQGEYKVRAPLAREGDGLRFATGIAKGAKLRVMDSSPEAQVEAARSAAAIASQRLEGASPSGALVFDCCCRRMILQQEFRNAVKAISAEAGACPIAGFESYGEVALANDDWSGFHNSTSVVVLFAGQPA